MTLAGKVSDLKLGEKSMRFKLRHKKKSYKGDDQSFELGVSVFGSTLKDAPGIEEGDMVLISGGFVKERFQHQGSERATYKLEAQSIMNLSSSGGKAEAAPAPQAEDDDEDWG
jgi:hypothetical protein